MVSTWVLIIWINFNSNTAKTVVIQDLPSEKVCQELGNKIATDRDGIFYTPEVSCYEIKNRFEGMVNPDYLEFVLNND
jgi:hypothetical protein